nr:lantibiotic dehydratase [Pirellulales bacterium]
GADGGPLLADIAIPQQSGGATAAWKPRHAVLLAKLLASREAGVQHIELTEADMQQMSSADPLPIPAALSVTAMLAASSAEALDAGDFRLLFTNAIGPSGAKMLGRFCHGDEQLEQCVRDHLQAEESLNPDAIFAEIVHLPEGRTGNVILRPVLREYEIPYLGRSGAPADKQLSITDLRVSIQAGRIVLRSAALNREIIPRLTNAHNYSWKGLGLYKFLCALQHQDVSDGLYWDWGPLESSEFLPRVTHGKLVLSRARWLLQSPELKSLLAAKGAELFTAVQTLRRERKLPRFVALRDSDNELPVDLDNILSIESLVDVLKGRDLATLVEMFPAANELTAVGPEGRFTHELVVPLLKRQPCPASTPAPMLSVATPSTTRRRFAPGSEWLYAKIYTGAATADRLLRDELRPVIDDAIATGSCDRWFFLRYSDPDGHLRIRFHGEPTRLREELLPRLEEVLAGPLDAGWVARVQFDTYERETERYGGDLGVELAEKLFHADSEAALSIIDTCSGDAGLDARWRLALRGIDQLLDDLGFDLAEKSEIMQSARDNFAREFGVGADFKQQTSARFRTERASLEALLNRACDHESLLQPGLAALDRRSAQLRHVAEQLCEAAAAGEFSAHPSDLAGSYIHMWVNRVLRSAHRAQELVLYDFLARLYQSAAARSPALRADSVMTV